MGEITDAVLKKVRGLCVGGSSIDSTLGTLESTKDGLDAITIPMFKHTLVILNGQLKELTDSLDELRAKIKDKKSKWLKQSSLKTAEAELKKWTKYYDESVDKFKEHAKHLAAVQKAAAKAPAQDEY